MAKLALVQHTQLSLDPSHETNVSPVESVAKFKAPGERTLWPEDHHSEYKLGDVVTLVVQARVGGVHFEKGILDKGTFTKDARGSDVQRVHNFVLDTPRMLTQGESLRVETTLANLDDAPPITDAALDAAKKLHDSGMAIDFKPDPLVPVIPDPDPEDKAPTDAALLLGDNGDVTLGKPATYTETNLQTLSIPELELIFQDLGITPVKQPKDVLIAMVLTATQA